MASQVARILCLALLSVGSIAAAQADCSLEDGITFVDSALDGEEGSVSKAIECLEALERDTPENHTVLAYLGSAYALKGRDADAVQDKMRFTNLDLDNLDYAVELAPDDFVVRIIRWNVGKALPSMFGREKKVVEDLHALDAIFQQSLHPRMAKAMVPAYAMLVELEPDNAKWADMKGKAESLAEQAD